MPRKWIAVRVSAGLAIAGSLCTLALGLLMPISMSLSPPPAGPGAPPFPMLAFGIIMAVIFAAFAAWGIATGIAIFRRRGWARISIICFAVLLTIMGAGGILAAGFMTLPEQDGVGPGIMTAVRFGMAGFYVLLAGIGIWWLLLFNKQTTKQYFGGADVAAAPDARPLSISIIGWYLVTSSIFGAAMAVFKLPAFVFGIVITGWGALGVYTLFTVLQLYLGTGLLHLQETARIGTIGYCCFAVLNSVLTMLPPGLAQKMEIMRREAPALFPAGLPPQMAQPVWVFAVMGMAFVAIPIWFLVKQRAAFSRV